MAPCPLPPQPKQGCSRNALLSLQAVSAQPAVSPGVSSEPWVPAACASGCGSLAGACEVVVQATAHGSLCSACCKLVVCALLGPLKLSLSVRRLICHTKGAFLSAGTFPLFQLLPRVQVPPTSCFSSLFYPTQSQGDLSCPFIGLMSASIQ